MATLFELTEQEHQALAVIAEHNGDTDMPEVQDALNALDKINESIEDKAEAYCRLIREMESRFAVRQGEARRLLALAETDANASKRLKERLKWALDSRGVTKLEAGMFRCSVARNGGKQPIEVDEDQVPSSFLVKTVVENIDNDKIREQLAAGKDLAFARAVERGTHLRIK